ncbi:hypothetical protein RJD24_18605 [Bacillaceae bacterium IKA-2]|nr:hypothetical protein RJD24_18605 [Bacillaceae bacterium IKA-2]
MSKKKKQETLVYCGPSINGELPQFSIFSNGIPDELETRIKECSSIKSMFHPVTKLSEVRSRLETQGTREHSLFKKIKEYLKGAR